MVLMALNLTEIMFQVGAHLFQVRVDLVQVEVRLFQVDLPAHPFVPLKHTYGSFSQQKRLPSG